MQVQIPTYNTEFYFKIRFSPKTCRFEHVWLIGLIDLIGQLSRDAIGRLSVKRDGIGYEDS